MPNKKKVITKEDLSTIRSDTLGNVFCECVF